MPIKPSSEVNGDLTFQPVGSSQAFFNGDITLKPNEVNPVIDAILANGLVFQAEHQHFYDFDPPVWFIHFRGLGALIALATAVHKVVKATSTPLPQQPPSHPTTPLDADRLQRILHGYDAEVGEDGVVTVFVARKEPIFIAGVRVRPQTNIETNIAIAFEPLTRSGARVAAAPDFGMLASEVDPVMRSCGRRAGTSAACTTRRPTSTRSCSSPTSSRPASPTSSPGRSAAASTG